MRNLLLTVRWKRTLCGFISSYLDRALQRLAKRSEKRHVCFATALFVKFVRG